MPEELGEPASEELGETMSEELGEPETESAVSSPNVSEDSAPATPAVPTMAIEIPSSPDSPDPRPQQLLLPAPQPTTALLPMVRRPVKREASSPPPASSRYNLRQKRQKKLRAFAGRVAIPEPASAKKALESPWSSSWRSSMDRELTALEENGTYTIVDPPPNVNIIRSRWVFKVRDPYDANLLKSRVVAKGFSQEWGTDYVDTFAPTVAPRNLRMFLTVVAHKDLECHHVDVNNAFTQATLKEVLYMEPPPMTTTPKGKVWRLHKSIYGLKQAAKDWYATCSAHLISMGFLPAPEDECIYINNQQESYVLLYVDDILIAAPDLDRVSAFKTSFGRRFKMKDLRDVSRIVGIDVSRDRQMRTLSLSQAHYVDNIMADSGMTESRNRPTRVPMIGSDALITTWPGEEMPDPYPYSRKVGQCNFLSQQTRPDISFAVGKLSKHVARPAFRHMDHVRHLLRFIRTTRDRKLILNRSGQPARLLGYSDANHAPIEEDRKSTAGYVFMLGGSPIAWRSALLKNVTISSTEAEYCALSEAARMAIPIYSLLRRFNVPDLLPEIPELTWTSANTPLLLAGDNQASLAVAQGDCGLGRVRHVDTHFHFARQLCRENKMVVKYVPTEKMIADGMTKPLPWTLFDRFVDQLGLSEGECSGVGQTTAHTPGANLH